MSQNRTRMGWILFFKRQETAMIEHEYETQIVNKSILKTPSDEHLDYMITPLTVALYSRASFLQHLFLEIGKVDSEAWPHIYIVIAMRIASQ